MTEWFKVGELARHTGVSVRTLHYYEQIGILCASHRTDSGHRLYGHDEVERLLRIKTLQHLGFDLDTITHALAARGDELDALLAERLIQERVALLNQTRRVKLLERLEEALLSSGASSISSLVSTIEEITMYEKHYTPSSLSSSPADARRSPRSRYKMSSSSGKTSLMR